MSSDYMRATDFWPLGFQLLTLSIGFIYAKYLHPKHETLSPSNIKPLLKHTVSVEYSMALKSPKKGNNS